MLYLRRNEKEKPMQFPVLYVLRKVRMHKLLLSKKKKEKKENIKLRYEFKRINAVRKNIATVRRMQWN